MLEARLAALAARGEYTTIACPDRREAEGLASDMSDLSDVSDTSEPPSLRRELWRTSGLVVARIPCFS